MNTIKFSNILTIGLLLSCFSINAQEKKQNLWENQHVFAINKLPARATSYSFEDIESALECNTYGFRLGFK